jgi:predicted dehydrogenase
MRLDFIRSSRLPALLAAMTLVLGASACDRGEPEGSVPAADQSQIRFMTLDPGHFHAALIHKEMYPQVSPVIDIYAPLGFDLIEHLGRISAFNSRPANPTSWRTEIHTSPDFFERMLKEHPGNAVVLAGKNSKKIDYILGSVKGGLNVLADKPWIVRSADLPRLEEALTTASSKGLVAYDIMTERYEITNMLQRELVNDPAVYGKQIAGTAAEPGVHMRSVHYILKTVAGRPLLRPVWFFDPREQGEALADVGTHLVDLSLWTLFPDQGLDYRKDVQVTAARRWPTVLSAEQFSRVSGQDSIPASLADWTRNGSLECACNTEVSYALRGVNVKLDVQWDTAAANHGDTQYAVYRGDRASVEVRQGAEEGWVPQTYVVPNSPEVKGEVLAAVQARVKALQDRWPGIGVEDLGDRIRISIPDAFRVGHEFHFSQVASRFLEYLKDPKTIPAYEQPNMLVKYFITTKGTELSHGAS